MHMCTYKKNIYIYIYLYIIYIFSIAQHATPGGK